MMHMNNLGVTQGHLRHIDNVSNTIQKQILHSIFWVSATMRTHPDVSQQVAVI